ncbi:hypothetical protein [Marinobacter shengliensis]
MFISRFFFVSQLFLFMILAGCSVNPITPSEAKNYSTVGMMIKDNFKVLQRNFSTTGYEINNPERTLELISLTFNNLKTYCESYTGGLLKRSLPLEFILGDYDINEYSGIYGCYLDDEGVWFVEYKTKHKSFNNYSLSLREVSERHLKKQIDIYARREARFRALKEANARAIERENSDWFDRAIEPKHVGQQVCSRDNKFGRIAHLQGNRVLVNVFGISSNYGNYRINKQVWGQHTEWAPCYFQ